MTKGMNWRRSHYQTRIRDHGSADWHGGPERDPAARWFTNKPKPKAKRLTRKQFLATRTPKYLDPADPTDRAAILRNIRRREK